MASRMLSTEEVVSLLLNDDENEADPTDIPSD